MKIFHKFLSLIKKIVWKDVDRFDETFTYSIIKYGNPFFEKLLSLLSFIIFILFQNIYKESLNFNNKDKKPVRVLVKIKK